MARYICGSQPKYLGSGSCVQDPESTARLGERIEDDLRK